MPEVENFLAKHRVRCQRYSIHRTIRSIIYTQQQKRKKAQQAKKAEEGEIKLQSKDGKLGPDKDLSPWDQYLKSNGGFTKHGHFMHTVAWQSNGRHILTVIPHPTRVDLEKVARAVQRPKETLKQRKLGDLAKQTGFPVFVCPPFGHPKDADGRDPILLVDSSVTELKRPLLFDCGTVGLCIPVSEFFRCTGAACIEGLGKVVEADATIKIAEKEEANREQSPRAALEPAPEPAPVAPPPGTWVAGSGGAPCVGAQGHMLLAGPNDIAPAKDDTPMGPS